MPGDRSFATIRTLLARLFPHGTAWPSRPTDSANQRPSLASVPFFPTDVFAASALLLTRSGALSRLLVGLPDGREPPSLRVAFKLMRDVVHRGGIDINDRAVRKGLRDAGVEWRQ